MPIQRLGGDHARRKPISEQRSDRQTDYRPGQQTPDEIHFETPPKPMLQLGQHVSLARAKVNSGNDRLPRLPLRRDRSSSARFHIREATLSEVNRHPERRLKPRHCSFLPGVWRCSRAPYQRCHIEQVFSRAGKCDSPARRVTRLAGAARPRRGSRRRRPRACRACRASPRACSPS